MRDFMKNMRKQNISSFAAGSAFFIFLSFIPLMMLVSAVLPYTPLTQNDLVDAMVTVFPGAAEGFVKNIISDVYAKAEALLPVAAIVLLWTAGKGMMSIVQGLNAINDVEEKRNYFVIRLMAMLYTGILLIVILLGLGIMVFGNLVANMIFQHIAALKVIVSLFLPFRFILSWVILTFVFCTLYAYVPNKKAKMRHQLPGACFAAVAWGVFSFGFSVYLEYGNSFDIYGSMTILIVVMIWLYFCMYIIFVGAYMNRYFQP